MNLPREDPSLAAFLKERYYLTARTAAGIQTK